MKLTHSKPKNLEGKNLKIAIVLCRYNDHLGHELLVNTTETLLEHGVLAKNIELIQVPGALETPLSAQFLAQKNIYQALIILGAVIKGETAHFDHVCRESYRGLMNVSLKTETPIIFGILTVNNEQEAQDRVSKKKLNKGKEYAEAAIEMALLIN